MSTLRLSFLRSPLVLCLVSADATDGLDISSAPLGPALPHGIMIEINSKPQNFLVFAGRMSQRR